MLTKPRTYIYIYIYIYAKAVSLQHAVTVITNF
jgi:hypothetical protein